MKVRQATVIFVTSELLFLTIIGLLFHYEYNLKAKILTKEELRALFDYSRTWPNGSKREIDWDKLESFMYQEHPEVFHQPSTEYEVIRRRIASEVEDMWDFFSKAVESVTSQLSAIDKNRVRKFVRLMAEHRSAAQANLRKLREIDGYKQWRLQEHRSLGKLMQRRINFLQNPKNCTEAKKIFCDFDNTWGWGNKMGRMAICLLLAYGTGRTLVFNMTMHRPYDGIPWTNLFKPLSKNCLVADGNSTAYWPGTNETQVLKVPAVPNYPNPPYWPQTIPRDISDRLMRLHGRPFAWMYGQFFEYLLRPQPYLEQIIAAAVAKFGFQKPIVGVHVRRTDKINEAQYHNLSEYMEHVESFYFQLELERPNITRRVYLATDEPNVWKEAIAKYPRYQFISYDSKLANADQLNKTTANPFFEATILDIYFLSRSDYLVCTFSSNMCRLVYEIMQSLSPDAISSARSVDREYFVYFQHAFLQEGLYPHYPRNPQEIEILPGDVITKGKKLFNGFSSGTNQRTKKSGLYPSFKAADKLDTANYPRYPEGLDDG